MKQGIFSDKEPDVCVSKMNARNLLHLVLQLLEGDGLLEAREAVLRGMKPHPVARDAAHEFGLTMETKYSIEQEKVF